MNKKYVGFAIISIVLFSYALFIASNSNNDKNIIRVATSSSDLIFTFSKNNLLVFSYEIRSLNETKENSLEYKKLAGETLEKKIPMKL